MAVFQSLFFLVLGLGLLIVVYRSLDTGSLPCGPNGLKGRLEFKRHEQPFGYWLMFVGYGIAGLWLLTFSLSLLAGRAEPLPLS